MDLLVGTQRRVAEAAGCAFFDSYSAMGGAGSLAKWAKMQPSMAATDHKHLNHRGRVVLGGWMYDAVISAYVDYRRGGGKAVPGAGKPKVVAPPVAPEPNDAPAGTGE